MGMNVAKLVVDSWNHGEEGKGSQGLRVARVGDNGDVRDDL